MRFKVLIVLFVLLILMGVLGFAPINLEGRINDKVLHFCSFFLLGACLYYLWNLSYRRNVLFASIILFFAAVLSEFVQGLLPYRTFDPYDILSNVTGGTCGIGLAFLLDYFFTSRRAHRRRWGGKREAEYQRALMDDIDLEEDDMPLTGSR
ncbi:hypothetical protein J3Q64DRAFT_1306779 [Phycomyces blakesleeanus]|uniref:VanZ-like domain-containing protein n=2 Tax=Phycomyces blakesleeanus TaxID=4837 RepID=A0A162NBB2_PHYB8|nr:hypothetical protein PHYBLDRAFT_174254 [Phycomyces blakesleeanus NRRL 1555(-)]OAD67564.1 hypothetical protein PHYBLDRAFT_174254 [Phycomyces blakesleeanus NRRL 1555(-)]|eukprot:XP_018285604.1 hypothetical protein PHYBLDRAFT_174254 [Phycomyces blakesleeanus NRRL 1555(-)]